MWRYLRLFAYFVRFSFSRAMEFRLDFFFRVVMDCLFYVVQFVFFFIIYRHTDAVGGWNLDQIIVFTAGYLWLDAVNMTLFSNNMWWLPMLINKGDLDYYLVRPVSSLFFVSLRDFAANSFMNLVIAGAILGWALLRHPGEIPLENYVAYAVLMALGSYFFYLVQIWFATPTFWLHSAQGLREIQFRLTQYAERPDQIFRPWLRRILLTVLPLALTVSVPTHVLFNGLTWPVALNVGGAAVFGTVFTIWFWNRGLRGYVSASS
ncbi:MAG: ABC-2 family transporter protein [Candidatus Sumerlaeia bacterium]|nr:ABC-2 family transporter protein [Candidatus Sumerlaeia bacterium]